LQYCIFHFSLYFSRFIFSFKKFTPALSLSLTETNPGYADLKEHCLNKLNINFCRAFITGCRGLIFILYIF